MANSWVERYLAEQDEDGYVPFNHDRRLGLNQYVSHYISGANKTRILSNDLRVKGNTNNCHSIRIHKDDLVKFHERVEQHELSGWVDVESTGDRYNRVSRGDKANRRRLIKFANRNGVVVYRRMSYEEIKRLVIDTLMAKYSAEFL